MRGRRRCAAREHGVLLVRPRILRLEQHDVELHAGERVDRRVVHVVAPRQRAAAAGMVRRARGVGHEVQLVRHLRQVVEVVAVDVPREDAQRAAAMGCRNSFCSAASITAPGSMALAHSCCVGQLLVPAGAARHRPATARGGARRPAAPSARRRRRRRRRRSACAARRRCARRRCRCTRPAGPFRPARRARHSDVAPARFRARRRMAAASAAASVASAALPVSTMDSPRAASASATAAKRSAGQRRERSCAPGWTIA